MPMSFCETVDGTVLMCNGIDPVLAYRPDDDSTQPAGVPAAGGGLPELRGGGAGTITGKYTCFARFVDRFGRVGNPTPFSLQATLVNAGAVNYANLPAAPDSTVARRQVLRNTDGQAKVFYVDIDTTDTTSPTLASARPDADLRDQPAQVMFDDPGRPQFNRFNPPPSTFATMTLHLGRVWGAGVQEYSEGSVRLAKGSAEVVGVGCRWRPSMAGRFFYHPSGFASEIAAVVPGPAPEGEQRLTLRTPWDRASDPFGSYSIRPERVADDTVVFSEAGLPEAFPADNAFISRREGDPVTALIPLRSFLFIARRRSSDRLTAQGDPRTDGYLFDAIARGCAGPRSWVVADGVAYILDERGVYTFDGKGATALSDPIQDIFRGDNRRGWRVNWTQARFFHTTYSVRDQTIRFFVTLNGGGLPRHALTLAAGTGKWWIEEYPVPLGASCKAPLGRRTGTYNFETDRPLLGGPAGRVYATRPGGDLAPGRPSEVVAAGSDWVVQRDMPRADPDAAVVIERGRGAGQVRRVAAVAADGRILVDRPWAVVPATGDRVILGGVPYSVLTHRLEYTDSEEQAGCSVSLGFEPRRRMTARIDLIPDYRDGPPPLAADLGPGEGDGLSAARGEPGVTVELGEAAGTAVIRAERHKEVFTPGERGTAVRVSGVSGASPQRLYALSVNGVERG